MNIASGSHDTGIYVGQSHDARVDHNLAHDNVDGFEIENSVNIKLDHNAAFHNTACASPKLHPARGPL
jgi:parallel beta-helix repeat protein